MTATVATPPRAERAGRVLERPPPPAGAVERAVVGAGNFLFKARDVVFPVVLVALLLGFRPTYPAGSRALDVALDALGLAIALTGQALRVAVIGLAYIKRGGKGKQVYAGRLVQEGLFAHARNPLYCGNLLVLAGLLVIHGNPWVLGLGAGFYLGAYLALTRAEEHYLAWRFGDEYARYRSSVNRFVPSLRGLGATMRSMTFDWRRVVRKEYGSTFSWVTCALATLALETVRSEGLGARPGELAALLVVWISALAAWATARVLKKRGTLGWDPKGMA